MNMWMRLHKKFRQAIRDGPLEGPDPNFGRRLAIASQVFMALASDGTASDSTQQRCLVGGFIHQPAQTAAA